MGALSEEKSSRCAVVACSEARADRERDHAETYVEDVSFHSPGLRACELPWVYVATTKVTPKVLHNGDVSFDSDLCNTFGVCEVFLGGYPGCARKLATLGCGI